MKVITVLVVFVLPFISAYVNEQDCLDYGGQCMPTSCCQGGSANYVSGKCPTQAYDIRCCTSSNTCYDPVEEPCVSNGGQCVTTSCCQGNNHQRGLCPSQPADVRCCFSTDTCAACPGCSAGSSGSCDYVTRGQWGARSPASTRSIPDNLSKAFIHHTAGSRCTSQSSCSAVIRGIQNYHMDTRGYDDIGYSFLVGGDGKIYEGRGFNRGGAHTQCYNSVSYGLSFMGDFSNGKPAPTQTMLNAAKNFLTCMKDMGKLSSSYKVYGHRDGKCDFTECPGQQLYDTIKTWSQYGPLPITKYRVVGGSCTTC